MVDFPEALDAYTFHQGSPELRLEPPLRGRLLGNLDYYCMDAASLLPVLMLDLKKNSDVLDMCAAPGGKSLAILQTLLPRRLVCNDLDHLRMKRLLNTMSSYLDGAGSGTWTAGRTRSGLMPVVEFKRQDGVRLPDLFEADGVKFDSVLCDVQCTTDRLSMNQVEDNPFRQSQIRLRLKIQERQSALLQ